MSQLRIYLTPEWHDAASPAAWALLDEAGKITQSGHSNLAGMPGADECIAIVSAASVLCVSSTLPRIKPRQLETALPLLLEEFMLGEPADNHVVPGKTLENGQTVLYAIDKNWLRQFVEVCALANLRLRHVLPEYALLPVQGGEWSLLWDGSNGWLAMPHYQGLMLGQADVHKMPAVLALQLAATQPAPTLRVYSPFAAHEASSALPQWSGVSLSPADQAFDWRTMPLSSDMPNLRWGKFSPPIRVQEWWPKIRPVAALLLLVLGIEATGYNIQWWLLAHEKSQLQHKMNGVFQETFGNDVEVVDAPLQMRRSLARQRHTAGVADDADFLPLLERVSAELAAQAGSQVTGLRYAEGQLDLESRLPSRSALEALQQHFSEQGLRAQTVEAKENNGGLEVHLRISSGGAQ